MAKITKNILLLLFPLPNFFQANITKQEYKEKEINFESTLFSTFIKKYIYKIATLRFANNYEISYQSPIIAIQTLQSKEKKTIDYIIL